MDVQGLGSNGKVKNMLSHILTGGHSKYDKWANNYDDDLTEQTYQAPIMTATVLSQALGSRKDVRIIDFLAGTGLVAKELHRCGFTNIDAVDANVEMLERARKKNLYKNIYCEFISSSPTPGLEADAYDAAVAAGSFYPGGLHFDALHEFIRVVKKGGLVTFGMNTEYDSPYKPEEYENSLRKLEEDGKAKLLTVKEREGWLLGQRGIVYTLQVL